MLRRALTPVTAAGRAVAGLGLISWMLGVRLGWDELLLVAGGCVAVLALAALLSVGRPSLKVILQLNPHRVVAGEQAVGRVEVTNSSGRRRIGSRLEVPVGRAAAGFGLPSLRSGATWEELFVIPTAQRAVLAVGPVSSVRGDPLGLVRRPVAWTDVITLYVHPRTVRLRGLTAGWIRDLEGRPTNDLSPSDVAFHTLREYVPGDDRRHVHWRTSARLGTLMVRQFVDSRRCHLGVLLSTSREQYASADEFELAVSIAASLGASALMEDQNVTLTVGGRSMPTGAPSALLDGLAGVELHRRAGLELGAQVRRSLPELGRVSVVALVGGSLLTRAELQAAASLFHSEVLVLGVRAGAGPSSATQGAGVQTYLDVETLEDLPRLMRRAVPV